MIYDVRTFGAVGDGKTLNTTVIQEAIDKASLDGGQVLIAGGVYKTGTIRFKSNVEIHLASDGVLLGSDNWRDYTEIENAKHVRAEGMTRHRNSALIVADECENISITGAGKIDGNGGCYVVKKQVEAVGWMYEKIKIEDADCPYEMPTPPRTVLFAGCKNVKIEDVWLVNQASCWAYWVNDCDFVAFTRCKILSHVNYPNNDGIHINASRNVTVSDCDISCGDDCIIVRANCSPLKENKICEKVTVTNCNLTSYSGGIRVGWSGDGVIRNCVFSNIVMTDTTCGIDIFIPWHPGAMDHGREKTRIENLSFNNVIMHEIYGKPIKIDINDKSDALFDKVQNIYFSNVHATGLEFPLFKGRKDSKLKNIYLSDCSFEIVSESTLPKELDKHGPAAWSKTAHCAPNWIYNAENVVVNNTTFSCEE